MKKICIAALAATALSMPVMAQDVVKNLFTSAEGQTVNWENTLKIEADQFADGVAVGNYLSLKCSWAKEAIEIKADGVWLPGTLNVNYGEGTDNVELKVYLTADGLDAAKTHGLEICGGGMTVNSLDVMSDGFNMPEGAVWGGYFWVSDWNTMELFKTALAKYDGQRFMDIYLSDDNGENTGYFMKVLTAWENPDAIWADNGQIEHGAKEATVNLQDVDIAAALADVNFLMIQSNPEGGNPYNLTAVALRYADDQTGAGVVSFETEGAVDVYSIDGVQLKAAVKATEVASELPAGLYIVGGKKVIVK